MSGMRQNTAVQSQKLLYIYICMGQEERAQEGLGGKKTFPNDMPIS